MKCSHPSTLPPASSLCYDSRTMKPKILIVLALVSVPFSASALAIDATGTGCPTIGTWDALSKTCTLTKDITTPISISSNTGITLDGAGHTITGPGGTFSTGVFLFGSHIIVKNLTLDRMGDRHTQQRRLKYAHRAQHLHSYHHWDKRIERHIRFRSHSLLHNDPRERLCKYDQPDLA